MKKLDSYEVLNNEVFYRGMNILDYLYSKEKISKLDLEAFKEAETLKDDIKKWR